VRVSTLKEINRIVLILAALAWFFYVVFQSRFQEGFMFPMAALTAVILLILVSDTRFRRIRTAALVLTMATSLAAGGFSILVAGKLDEKRVLKARAIMDSVSKALLQYQIQTGTLPECHWDCMAEKIDKAGFWTRKIQYWDQGRQIVEPMYRIPPRDLWGCRYHYKNLGDLKFELLCSGPDRRFGTRDDIVLRSWEKEPSYNLL